MEPQGRTATRSAAVFDDMKPYLLATGAVSLLAGPTEVVLPIVRRLRGRTGIATGPGLLTLSHGLVGLGIVHAVRRNPERVTRLKETEPSRWMLALPLYLLLSPVAVSERAVVLRDRSPLWGDLFSPLGGLHVALTLTAVARAARARSRERAAPATT